LNRLGLLSSEHVAPKGKLIDSLCVHLERELSFKEGERDLVILHHDFLIQRKNGQKENLTSTLVTYGTPGGYTAMAKTVGLPTAFATHLLLDGQLKRTGVLAPMTKDIYQPLLDKLEAKGIHFVEK
jgi:saccharopine dehydrogenase-like NADP-dependent oxidoreductase